MKHVALNLMVALAVTAPALAPAMAPALANDEMNAGRLPSIMCTGTDPYTENGTVAAFTQIERGKPVLTVVWQAPMGHSDVPAFISSSLDFQAKDLGWTGFAGTVMEWEFEGTDGGSLLSKRGKKEVKFHIDIDTSPWNENPDMMKGIATLEVTRKQFSLPDPEIRNYQDLQCKVWRK